MPSLTLRIRTRLSRAVLDEELAYGAEPAASPDLALRAEQLSSRAERARIADALLETLGREPITTLPRPQRAVVRGAADDIVALALRLHDDRPAAHRGSRRLGPARR